jgi:hypothetical protein
MKYHRALQGLFVGAVLGECGELPTRFSWRGVARQGEALSAGHQVVRLEPCPVVRHLPPLVAWLHRGIHTPQSCQPLPRWQSTSQNRCFGYIPSNITNPTTCPSERQCDHQCSRKTYRYKGSSRILTWAPCRYMVQAAKTSMLKLRNEAYRHDG